MHDVQLMIRSSSILHLAVLEKHNFPAPRKRGRPPVKLNEVFLRKAFNTKHHIPITKLSKAIGVHRNTLARKLRELGISRSFTEISDAELETLIREYREEKPEAGETYVVSFLRNKNIRVPRERVRRAMQEVDGVGVRLRRKNEIVRQVYKNPRPMAVWHVDGHLKGILWGITIHGIIDGYSRKVSTESKYAITNVVSGRRIESIVVE